jgi:hypothetical protein
MPLETKVIEINGKTFVLSKIPATVAVEIMAKGGIAVTLQRGEYNMMEAMMIKSMNYVAIRRPGIPDLLLSSRELIDNHCVDYKTYLAVLEALREYNEGFFIQGSLSSFCENHIQTLPGKIIEMLSRSLPRSVTPSSPPSTN